MKMASFEERLKDNGYKLWIKDGLCLSFTKKGLEKFIDERSKKTHAFIKSAVEKQGRVISPEGDLVAMTKVCDNAKIVTDTTGRWSLGCCKKDCEIYVKEILKLCKQQAPGQSRFKPELSNWENSDVHSWPTKHWEIAKVFMNKGQMAFQKTPADTDLSGLLNFIDHCSVPWVDIQNKDNIAKVRDARNSTMHSASMKITNAEFLAHSDAMLALLQDPLFIDKIQEAQDAATEIHKILQNDIFITPIDELKVLTDKTSALQGQNDRLNEEVNELKLKIKYIEADGNLQEKALRGLIELEAGQREEEISKLKDEIAEKEGRLRELTTELNLVKKLIDRDKDLCRKMDVRLKHVETTLGNTATEFREIKQSHFLLVEKVQRIQEGIRFSGFDLKFLEHQCRNVDNLKEEKDTLTRRLKMQAEELDELRIENKVLKQTCTVTSIKRKDQDNAKLLTAEKEIKDLVSINENVTKENKYLKDELRRKANRNDIGKDCTNRECKNKLEALEYEVKCMSKEKDLAARSHALEDRNLLLEAQLALSNKETEDRYLLIEELKHDLDLERNKIQRFTIIIAKTKSEKLKEQEMRATEKAEFEKQMQALQLEKTEKETELLEQIQHHLLEIECLKKNLKENSKCVHDSFSQSKSTTASLNADTTQMQTECTCEEIEYYVEEEEASTSEQTTENDENTLKDTDAILPGQSVIKLSEDEKTPWITGAVFMSNGCVILCDKNNNKVKVLDKSFNVKGSLLLKSEPWDVSELDTNTCIVTLPYLKERKLIKVQPFLKERKTFHLKDRCLGIDYYKGRLYMSYQRREGNILVADLNGKHKRNIDVHGLGGSIVFNNPEKIAVNKFGSEVLAISDNFSNTVTIVGMDGALYCQYSDPDLKRPGGLCFDVKSNVIVCGSESKNVHIISLSGKKLKIIATPRSPITVAYRDEDDTIIVGFETDYVLFIDLKCIFKN